MTPELSSFVVKGIAMVPVYVEIPVRAENQEEAIPMAFAEWDKPGKHKFIVPNSVDERAVYDFRWNEVTPG